MAFGITPTGFVVKTLETIRAELDDDARDKFGASVDVSDESDLGQLLGIIAERESELWELAETAYNSNDRDAATGQALDAVGALTGSTRQVAASSTTTLTLTGDESTLIPSSSQSSVGITEDIFNHDTNSTLALAGTWVALTAFSLGDIRSNTNGGDTIWVVVTAGTSAAGAGPNPTTVDFNQEVTDGTITWRRIGDGLSFTQVAATSDNTGAIVGAIFTINQIDTPIGGWSDVLNLAAAVLDNDLETDESFRIRQEEELDATGDAPLDAIRSKLIKVTGVTSVAVFQNTTDAVDADGLPPHSVEALVEGGADQVVFDALFDSVAAGIATFGSTSGTVTDSEGINQTYNFSRPTIISIDSDVVFEFDPDVTTEAITEAAILARLPLFASYVALALTGSFAAGLAYGFVV